MRSLLLTLALVATSTTAAAQRRAPAPVEETAERAETSALREGLRAVAEGRLADAFVALHRATERSPQDAGAWRALAEVAERLRVDGVALDGYRRYLELSTEAEDRAEIEGRVRALEHLARGARFVAREDQGALRLVVEGGGEAAPEGRPGNVLVDWQGRPLRVRRSSELLSLAEWDGSVHGDSESDMPRELMPFPSTMRRGLGRRLASP